MREGWYETDVVQRLRQLYPGCVILKNDTRHLQGIPDRSIFYNDRWAMLEFKVGRNARAQPNQQYYVDMLNEMSYASFIYPENEAEVLGDLQSALHSRR